jgi:hypothetical protein
VNILSLGAGVQSTTMALMAAHGEIEPMPDCAIFADTGWEPKSVYEHLEWLMSDNVLPFPVHVVSIGNLRDRIGSHPTGRKYARLDIPVFSVSEDGKRGMITRNCTVDYKITPIRNKIRSILGIAGRKSPDHVVCVQWLGISLDEVQRMKPSREGWQENRWPLIEQRMNRNDCLQWMGRNNYPLPPRSACIGCPFRSDHEWRALTEEEFADAVAVDDMLRDPEINFSPKDPIFLHSSLTPLRDADLSTAEDRGQLNMFNNECEGMCGV